MKGNKLIFKWNQQYTGGGMVPPISNDLFQVLRRRSSCKASVNLASIVVELRVFCIQIVINFHIP